MLNDSHTSAGYLCVALMCASPTLAHAQTNTNVTDENSSAKSIALEADFDICIIDAPDVDPKTMPTNIEADSLSGTKGQQAIYSGDVIVTQGNRKLKADTITLDQPQDTVVAEGNVQMANGQIKTRSTKTVTHIESNDTRIENAQYQFLCEPGRGDAKVIYSKGKTFYELKDGTITSCPEGDNSWRLRSSSIEIDQNKQQATLYNPRFEIQRVPVFYLPYLTVPIGDERKTGFLYPSIAYGSRDGFEVEVPFYWNLAPNYDLKTTAKYMQNRGVQLDNNFRLLTDLGRTSITYQYLHEDQLYPELENRWGVGVYHTGILNDNWKFVADYGEVSDIYFFRDIDSNIGEREDGQLLQEAYVAYRNANWDATLRARSFQLLSNTTNYPYQMLPQLEIDYYRPQMMKYLDFDVIAHITQFKAKDHVTNKPDTATRVHIEPGIKVPLVSTWGSLITEGRLLATYYTQHLDNISTPGSLEEELVRVLPEFQSTATLILERETSLFGGYTQTLEPTIQYLYIAEVEQDNIYSYDTTVRQGDYYGLFRNRRNSGVDEVVAASQISYGTTTRFYDNNFKERANLAFGQIVHLDDSYADPNNEQLAWALEADFNFNDYLFYHGGLYYSVDNSRISTADSTLEYRYSGGYIQANYRYVDRGYINTTLELNDNTLSRMTTDGISQAGLLTSYSFNRNWNISGQYFHDMTEDMMLEFATSLRYTDDCWYIGLTYSDLLRSYNPSTPLIEGDYEQNLTINFGIIGFGTRLGSDSGTLSDTLTGEGNASTALGYGRPFYLNN